MDLLVSCLLGMHTVALARTEIAKLPACRLTAPPREMAALLMNCVLLMDTLVAGGAMMDVTATNWLYPMLIAPPACIIAPSPSYDQSKKLLRGPTTDHLLSSQRTTNAY